MASLVLQGPIASPHTVPEGRCRFQDEDFSSVLRHGSGQDRTGNSSTNGDDVVGLCCHNHAPQAPFEDLMRRSTRLLTTESLGVELRWLVDSTGHIFPLYSDGPRTYSSHKGPGGRSLSSRNGQRLAFKVDLIRRILVGKGYAGDSNPRYAGTPRNSRVAAMNSWGLSTVTTWPAPATSIEVNCVPRRTILSMI